MINGGKKLRQQDAIGSTFSMGTKWYIRKWGRFCSSPIKSGMLNVPNRQIWKIKWVNVSERDSPTFRYCTNVSYYFYKRLRLIIIFRLDKNSGSPRVSFACSYTSLLTSWRSPCSEPCLECWRSGHALLCPNKISEAAEVWNSVCTMLN